MVHSLYLWTFCEQTHIVDLHRHPFICNKNIFGSLYFSLIRTCILAHLFHIAGAQEEITMYSKDTFDDFASLNNIIKLLKKDSSFNSHCQQEKIMKGDIVELADAYNVYFYIIQSGCMKYNHDLDSTNESQFLISAGDMPLLRPYAQELHHRPVCTALIDTIWWKIDFPFFKKCLLVEDPKNIILVHQLEQTRKKLFGNYLKNLLSSRQRVLFSLAALIDGKVPREPNVIELPDYLNYNILAELSATSKNYTSDILSDLRGQNILVSTKKPWIISDMKKFRALTTSENIPYL